MRKLSTGLSTRMSVSSRTCARGLDVDGYVNIQSPIRPPARAREELACSWLEACKAADYALEHFGDRERDRGIWVWYCQRLGLGTFLDLVNEVISCMRQGEIKWPVRAFQRHLMDALPHGKEVR